MFAAAGTLLNVSQRAQNLGKVQSVLRFHDLRAHVLRLRQPPRYKIDTWDEMMMERDRRLTGHVRGQRVRPVLSFTLQSTSEAFPDGIACS